MSHLSTLRRLVTSSALAASMSLLGAAPSHAAVDVAGLAPTEAAAALVAEQPHPEIDAASIGAAGPSSAVWSRGAGGIAFVADDTAAAPAPQLWEIDADGTDLRQLTSLQSGSWAPWFGDLAWAPNDAWIAYTVTDVYRHAAPEPFVARAHQPVHSGAVTGDLGGFTHDSRFLSFRLDDRYAYRGSIVATALGSGTFETLASIKYDGSYRATTTWGPRCDWRLLGGWSAPATSHGELDDWLTTGGCRLDVDPPALPSSTTPQAASPATTAQGAGRPDTAHASDAPPGTTTPNPAPGTNLVAINARTGLPIAQGPSLRFRSAAKSLDTALDRGLRVKFDVAGATSVKAYAIAPGTEGDDDTTLARTSIARPASGTIVGTLRFSGAARRTLSPAAKVRLTVRLVASDAKGHRTVVERAVDLR